MERHIGPWDQRPATYVAIRDFVGNTPHGGGPGFLAYVLATTPAGMFGPAELWDGERWVDVPAGWYVARRGKNFYPLAPEDHAAMEGCE
jgi:hypothetical protein